MEPPVQSCFPAGTRVAASDPPMAQCRFCLEESLEIEMMAPCNCAGTARFVHVDCLRTWQNEACATRSHERASICTSCRAPFSLPPRQRSQSASREFGISSSRRRELAPQGPLFERIQTNPHFENSATGRLASSLRQQLRERIQPGCLVLRVPDSPLPVIRAEHWRFGSFLIAGVFPNQGVNSSEALIGVNLAGALLSPLGAMPSGEESRAISELRSFLAPTVRLLFYRGGPVQQQCPLVLLSLVGPVASSLPPLVHYVLPAPSGLALSQEQVPRCTCALFAEPGDMLSLLRGDPALHLQVVGAAVFKGHAVWNGPQLLSEVARGSWGLARAVSEDLDTREPPEEREAFWRRLWDSREPLFAAPPRGLAGPSRSSSRSQLERARSQTCKVS